MHCVTIENGELAEWSNAAVLKTVVPQGTRGSNPLLSATLVYVRSISRFFPILHSYVSFVFQINRCF